MTAKFQRARKPEEKEVRRQAILKAARKLMGEVGSIDVGLNELARRARLSKSNLYRYFESREEVLLQVWIEEVRELVAVLAVSFERTPVGDVPAITEAIVEAFAAQPRMCELTSIIASVVERKLSAEAIFTAKSTLVELIVGVGAALHGRLPAVPLDECAWAAHTIGTYVVGLWPGANPGPTVREVMARPELVAFNQDFRLEMTRFLDVFFRGLLHRRAAQLG